MNKPCEICAGNRWKTIIKGKKYQCRSLVLDSNGKKQKECGNIKTI